MTPKVMAVVFVFLAVVAIAGASVIQNSAFDEESTTYKTTSSTDAENKAAYSTEDYIYDDELNVSTDRNWTIGLGPQCPDQNSRTMTIGDMRRFLLRTQLSDDAKIILLVDGKIARTASVWAEGCFQQFTARRYGIEHCDNGQAPDIMAIY